MSLKAMIKRLLRRMGTHRPRYYRDAIFRRVTEKDLHAFFTELGLRPGMLVYLQSSYSGIGHFAGGPRGLLEVLIQILGPSGTLVLPSFPTSGSMAEYAAAKPVFDVQRTPAKIGVLPEVFRTMPGVRRSIHPTHPVCAVGAEAEFITTGHEHCQTPQQPSSPFGKLYARSGHILRIGTRANPLTHTLQEMADWPNLFLAGDPVSLACVAADGTQLQVTTRLYRSSLPYVLYLEDQANGKPLQGNIMDFPIITDFSRQAGLATGRVLETLLELRQRFGRTGELRVAKLHQTTCDFYPIRSTMDFSVAEASRVIDKYRYLYDVAALERAVAAEH